MKLDDLMLQNKLVDKNTHAIVGYLLISNKGRVVALTKPKMITLGMDLANYIDYTDAETLEVISSNNCYSSVENIIYHKDEYSDIPYKLFDDNTVAIFGDVIQRFRLISLDSEASIRNVLAE